MSFPGALLRQTPSYGACETLPYLLHLHCSSSSSGQSRSLEETSGDIWVCGREVVGLFSAKSVGRARMGALFRPAIALDPQAYRTLDSCPCLLEFDDDLSPVTTLCKCRRL